ncbi:hypothetical protein GGI24_002127 [Coemansia furcata]|nr:hypothetical protein GGI24_002127 [Coemansia furcata]
MLLVLNTFLADRRPVDPPPIIQLHVSDPTTTNNRVYLHNPYYFMYATLMDESGERELNTLNDKKARTMTGSVVASLAHLKDIDGNDGAFFVFPDLSVRCEGVYKLKFSLFEIVGNQIFFCKSIMSTSFTVYSAKKFPGMEESTRLTKLFAEQGLKIRVRKEQKSTRPKGARSRPIATALQSDSASSAHRTHMPTWGSDHRLPASVGMVYSNPPLHHFERQPYSAATMSNNLIPAGSATQAGGSGGSGASSSLRATPPPGPWSGVPVRLAINSGSALSQSPPPQLSVSQYAMSDMQRNPDSETTGNQLYGQQQQQQQYQQHKSRRGISPSSHTPSYRGHQQATGYTQPIANTLSSPNMDVGHSAFSALPPGSQRVTAPHSQYQPQPLSMSKTRPQTQSQPQHPQHHTSSMLPRSSYSSTHMLPPISGQGPGHMVHSPDHRSQQPYRHAPAIDDDVRSPPHQYSQRRPWSPHHRSQQQHYSPTHTGHGFGSEPRYSPYTRQVDAPPRDSRQHLSPGPGARIASSFAPSTVTENAPIYPDQSSFRHQQHPQPARAQPVDNLQYYHLASSQRSARYATGSPMAPEADTPAHDLHAPPPPLPPVSPYTKHEMLLDTARDPPPAHVSAPSQQRRIAVHSLLISDSSSSPEKANGSPH